MQNIIAVNVFHHQGSTEQEHSSIFTKIVLLFFNMSNFRYIEFAHIWKLAIQIYVKKSVGLYKKFS